MPDSETEDDILARIETALQKIAVMGKPRPMTAAAQVKHGLDRDRVATALNAIIGRLRDVLEPPAPDAAPGQHTE